MTNLPLENIEKGIRKSCDNSHNLFNDGELLFKNKRYSSAYALFQLSSEEEAKLKLLVHLALEKRCNVIFTKEKKDYYNKFFISHNDKIRGSSTSDYTYNEFAPKFGLKKIRNDKAIKNEILNPQELNKLKQAAIYVTIDNKIFKEPSEIIDRKKCSEIRSNVKLRINIGKSLVTHYFDRTDQFVLTFKNSMEK